MTPTGNGKMAYPYTEYTTYSFDGRTMQSTGTGKVYFHSAVDHEAINAHVRQTGVTIMTVTIVLIALVWVIGLNYKGRD